MIPQMFRHLFELINVIADFHGDLRSLTRTQEMYDNLILKKIYLTQLKRVDETTPFNAVFNRLF